MFNNNFTKYDFSYVFNYFCEPTTTEKEVTVVKREPDLEKGELEMNSTVLFNYHSIVYEHFYTEKKTN